MPKNPMGVMENVDGFCVRLQELSKLSNLNLDLTVAFGAGGCKIYEFGQRKRNSGRCSSTPESGSPEESAGDPSGPRENKGR